MQTSPSHHQVFPLTQCSFETETEMQFTLNRTIQTSITSCCFLVIFQSNLPSESIRGENFHSVLHRYTHSHTHSFSWPHSFTCSPYTFRCAHTHAHIHMNTRLTVCMCSPHTCCLYVHTLKPAHSYMSMVVEYS